MSDDNPGVPANEITLDFADGEYVFRLPCGQIAELQTKCDAGIGEIYSRLWSGRFVNRDGSVGFNPMEAKFKYEDIVEVIRLGLIGGNKGLVNGEQITVNPAKALNLIRHYVHTRPLLENWTIAAAIMSAFVQGYDDPQKSKKKARTVTPKETGGST